MKSLFKKSLAVLLSASLLGTISIPVSAADQLPLLGDVDSNQSVDSADAMKLLQSIESGNSLSQSQKWAGDVNQDGSLTQSDVQLILDYISGKADGFAQRVTVSLSNSSLELLEGGSYTLKATLSKTVSGNITWSSSDSSVVSVDNKGTITGLKPGQATITVQIFNGMTASCTVKVTEDTSVRWGIDVSHHQGEIDWADVKASGVDFAIIRAGFGYYDSNTDSQFINNMKNAQAQGMPVGSYHYSYAENLEESAKDAYYMLNKIQGYSFDYPIFYDMEDNTMLNGTGGDRTLLTNMALQFCSILRENGYYAAVYANKNWLTNYLDAEKLEANGIDVWLAHYTSQTDYRGTYTMWQYSSTGRVDGISGDVDLDYCYVNYPQIIKNSGLNTGTKSYAKSAVISGTAGSSYSESLLK